MPPCILHAPGSLVTYEPQWGSDVFGMYQSLVEGRYVPWELLVKDVPKESTTISTISSSSSTGPGTSIRASRTPLPGADLAGGASEGYADRWIVYGKVAGEEFFTAKELTVKPGTKITIKDNGAYGRIAVQG